MTSAQEPYFNGIAAEPASLTELIALKRSAHHAFIEWLCGWKRRPTLFINNVFPSRPPRFGTLTIYRRELIDAADQKLYDGNTAKAFTQDRYDILVNFEGRSADNIRAFNSSIHEFWGAKTARPILFLRDPLNNFSSLTKRIVKTSFNQHLKGYFQTLRFCDYIDEIRGASGGGEKLFADVILFSAWQRDEAYRRSLAERYGLEGTALKSEVPGFGGGSSFSGQQFDPVKEQEKLFSRWREMQSEPFFLSLFLNDRVFGAIEAYYDMFGAAEPTKASLAAELRLAAQRNPEAIRLCRIWLNGFEESHAVFDHVEREKGDAKRKLLRGYLKSKIMVRRVFYRGFSA